MAIPDGFNASSIVITHPDETMPSASDMWRVSAARVAKRREEDAEVREHIIQLDKMRQECEEVGDYSKAQRCVDRIREINLRYAKKIELEARRVDVGWRQRMAENQRLELLTFHEMWEAKMIDYDTKANDLRNDLDRQQAIEMRSCEEMSQLELMDRRLRPSRALVELRDTLKQLVAQRMYAEAERIQKNILRREAEEQRDFENDIDRKLQDRMRAESERQRVERAALEQRLTINREELLAERRRDFEALTKRHAAALRAQEQSTALIIARAKGCIHRQVQAFVKDPVKAGLNLTHLSEVALCGGGGGGAATVDWGAHGREGTSILSASQPRDGRLSSTQCSKSISSARPPWQG